MEREVDLGSLENTFILNVFRDLTWAPLLTCLVEVHDIFIREFFSNAFVEGDYLNCWVRGKEFSISTLSIQNLLQIRPVIPEFSLFCDKRKTLVSEVVPDLGGEQKRQSLHTISFSPDMRMLAYIMLFSLYLGRNLITLSQPRALFLHDLYKKKDIDICAHIYYLLAKCVNKKKTQMTLLFPGLIMSIMHQESVKIPFSLPIMKREDPIST